VSEPFHFKINDYVVFPRPRWGYGEKPHPRLQAVLSRGCDGYESILRELAKQRTLLHQIGHEPDPAQPLLPYWNNIWFTALDAAVLMGLLHARKPRNYVEIGSGHSTRFAAHAIRTGNLPTSISSIDPNPRTEVDALCQRMIRAPLENCDLGLFDELKPGDVLFFDGSHRIFQNSDVTAFFLDVLPRLKPGILVHVHDIFLPADYPKEWATSLFSEQYILAAMLLCSRPPFRVVFPGYFVCTHDELGERARKLFRATGGGAEIPFHYKNEANTPGNSFWFETV
jgi:hypothetical protein